MSNNLRGYFFLDNSFYPIINSIKTKHSLFFCILLERIKADGQRKFVLLDAALYTS